MVLLQTMNVNSTDIINAKDSMFVCLLGIQLHHNGLIDFDE